MSFQRRQAHPVTGWNGQLSDFLPQPSQCGCVVPPQAGGTSQLIEILSGPWPLSVSVVVSVLAGVVTVAGRHPDQ